MACVIYISQLIIICMLFIILFNTKTCFLCCVNYLGKDEESCIQKLWKVWKDCDFYLNKKKKSLYKYELTAIIIIYYIVHLYCFQTVLFCYLYSHIPESHIPEPLFFFFLYFRKVKLTVQLQQKFLMNSVNIFWEDIVFVIRQQSHMAYWCAVSEWLIY